jgi:hypothetical protein
MLRRRAEDSESSSEKIKIILTSKLVKHPNKPFNHILNQVPVLPDGFMELKSPTSSSMKNTFILNRVTKA